MILYFFWKYFATSKYSQLRMCFYKKHAICYSKEKRSRRSVRGLTGIDKNCNQKKKQNSVVLNIKLNCNSLFWVKNSIAEEQMCNNGKLVSSVPSKAQKLRNIYVKIRANFPVLSNLNCTNFSWMNPLHHVTKIVQSISLLLQKHILTAKF